MRYLCTLVLFNGALDKKNEGMHQQQKRQQTVACQEYFQPGFLSSLRHFGHLFHNSIKTRRNSIHWRHQPTFSGTMTELIQFFFGHFKKIRSVAEK